MRFRFKPLVLCLLILLGVLPRIALAHEIRPAIVTITAVTADRVEATVALNLEGMLAGVGPEHTDTNDAPEAAAYNALRQLAPAGLRQRFDASASKWLSGVNLQLDGRRVALAVAEVTIPAVGDPGLARISTVRLTGPVSGSASNVTWAYAKEYGSSIVRVRLEGQEAVEGGWLKDGQSSAALSLRGGVARSKLAVMFDYVQLGFTHIVPKGIDHILFVLGLYFLGTQWRPLLIQVTAFTLAHSITLALGLYGVVDVSPRIVEPLIALSIVYVAVENILTDKLTPWRPFVVFLFGLLHGLGFAGILREVDLQPANYLTALIGFNVGVELGQLAVIAAAWVVAGYWFRHQPWYRARVVWPVSAVIALVGLGWTVERIWFA
jgi:hypothetical protein